MTKFGRQRALSIAKYLGPSAITFLAGTGALIVVDILLGRYANEAELNDWVVLKSLMLPLASLVMLGADQVVVREPSKIRLFIRPLLLMATLLTLVAVLVTYVTGFYDKPVILVLAVMGIAATQLFFGIFRAVLSFNTAQFARDGWKFIFLLALGPCYFLWQYSVPQILIAVLALCVIALIWRLTMSGRRDAHEVHNEVHDFKSALNVSWPFCMAAVALSIASYGELLLLKGFGGTDILPAYFRATILFVAPFLAFNTYIATFLGSAIRQQPNRFSVLMIRYRWYALALLPICPMLALIAGYILSPFIFPQQETPLSWAILLSITAGMRLGYSLLTSFIGSLGNRSEITAISFYYLVVALSTPAICYAVFLATDQLGVSVAATGAIHWLARSTVGWSLTARLCRRHV